MFKLENKLLKNEGDNVVEEPEVKRSENRNHYDYDSEDCGLLSCRPRHVREFSSCVSNVVKESRHKFYEKTPRGCLFILL